jgi:5-methylcytosine-specific restriction endonuclease McrA
MPEFIGAKFMWRVTFRAFDRQSKRDSKGNIYATCARCGVPLLRIFEGRDVTGGWYAIPRIPIAKGGNKRITNCVALCPKCFKKVEQGGDRTIPYSELPYFEDC